MDKVEQRARELLYAAWVEAGWTAEAAKVLSTGDDTQMRVVIAAIVAALSQQPEQQPEARGVVDAPSINELARDAMAALLRSDKTYASWSDLAGDALAAANAMHAALTGERNG